MILTEGLPVPWVDRRHETGLFLINIHRVSISRLSKTPNYPSFLHLGPDRVGFASVTVMSAAL